jgi:hypothetical protein
MSEKVALRSTHRNLLGLMAGFPALWERIKETGLAGLSALVFAAVDRFSAALLSRSS